MFASTCNEVDFLHSVLSAAFWPDDPNSANDEEDTGPLPHFTRPRVNLALY